MASDDGVVKVSRDEVLQDNAGSSVVGEEGKEEAKPTDTAPTGETPTTVSTPTPEDEGIPGEKPSMKDKVKRKIGQVGDKLRPKSAVESKNADPHPELT